MSKSNKPKFKYGDFVEYKGFIWVISSVDRSLKNGKPIYQIETDIEAVWANEHELKPAALKFKPGDKVLLKGSDIKYTVIDFDGVMEDDYIYMLEDDQGFTHVGFEDELTLIKREVADLKRDSNLVVFISLNEHMKKQQMKIRLERSISDNFELYCVFGDEKYLNRVKRYQKCGKEWGLLNG